MGDSSRGREATSTGHAQEAAIAPGHPTLHRAAAVSYTHLRAHETVLDLVCRLLLEKNKQTHTQQHNILKKQTEKESVIRHSTFTQTIHNITKTS